MKKRKLLLIMTTIVLVLSIVSLFTYHNYLELLRIQNEEKKVVLNHFYDELSLKLSQVVTFTKGLEAYVYAEKKEVFDQDMLNRYCDVALNDNMLINGIYIVSANDVTCHYPETIANIQDLDYYDMEENPYAFPSDALKFSNATYISDVLKDAKGSLKTVVGIPIYHDDLYVGYIAVIADIDKILNGSKSKIEEVIGTYRLRNDSVTYIGDEVLKDISVRQVIRIADYEWYLEAFYDVKLQDALLNQHVLTSTAMLVTLVIIGLMFTRVLSNNFMLSGKVQEMIYQDALTLLPNRRALIRDIDYRIEKDLPFTLAFLDLDNFKDINDTLGHSQGDIVLKTIAGRLMDLDNVHHYRWGGDEFVIITDAVESKLVTKTINNVSDALHQEIRLQDASHRMTGSIGICEYPKDGATREEIIRHADATMYEVKNHGKNHIAYYYDDIGKRVDVNFEVVRDLEKAINTHQLQVYYQPQYDIITNNITSLEALVRWPKPDGSFIPPSEFVTIAEASNLVHHIDEFVLVEVLKQIQIWHDQGKDIKVAINVSASHFTVNFMEFLKEQLEIYQVPNYAIELEITETAAIQDFKLVKQLVTEMKNIGITIALDDFGTGYSSLNALSQIDISTLKIDRSFVSRMTKNDEDLMIIKSIRDIANTFNIRLIAEGVETKDQLDKIRDIGIDVVQGYYFSKPLPVKNINKLL